MRTVILSLFVVVGSVSPSWATSVVYIPLYERVPLVQAIVIGKVTEVEKKPVQARLSSASKEKVEMSVVVFKVEEALWGAKGVTSMRVAFVPPPPPNPLLPPLPGVDLPLGAEVCLFVHQLPDEEVAVVPDFQAVVSKKQENFQKEMEKVRKYVRLLSELPGSLQTKDPTDRLLAASLAVTRYRGMFFQSMGNKTEPIDAAESKQILEILAHADWSKGDDRDLPSPATIFSKLGVKESDGFKPGMAEGQAWIDYTTRWLKDNAAKYRIQRLVPAK
jgi:hypothetical protein